MVSVRDAFELRLDEFENDHRWNEEQDCVLRGFLGVGAWMTIALGDEVADGVMAAIRQALVAGGATTPSQPWREQWVAAEELARWPRFFDDLHDLAAFAEMGVYRPWRLVERDGLSEDEQDQIVEGADVPGWARRVVDRIDLFLKLAPGVEGAPYDALMRTRAKALARLKLDEGQPLSPQELADLSGLSLKRVQNAAYEKGGRGPVLNAQGRIEPEGARDWLERKGFRFSIWPAIAELAPLATGWGREADADPAALVNDGLAEGPEEDLDDYVFVPVASDKSRFLPEARRAQGYQIGRKGAERWVDDYFEALEALRRQPTPRWRRPGERGAWGIVSGVTWERVRMAELVRLLERA